MFLLRVVAGFLFVQHGGSKLFGWFFSEAVSGTDLGAIMMVAGILEVFGGLAIILGLLTRPIAFLLAGEMAVAYFTVHFAQAFWPIQNGGEPAALFAFIFLFLAAHGAGRWSLDHKLHKK